MIEREFVNASGIPYPKRVFCDIHDTLEEPLGSGGPPYNERLLRDMKTLQDNGYEIVLFSGSPGRCQSVAEMCLFYLGDANIFGPVHNKKDFEGTGARATIVFDNDHASHDIEANYKLGPLDDIPALPGMRTAGCASYKTGEGYVLKR